MNQLLHLLMILVAAVVGYAVMVLFLILVQDLTLGRPELGKTSFLIILLVGIGSTLAAGIGGWVAGKIKKSRQLHPQILMCCLLIVESTYLITNQITINPVWFEIMASMSLLFGVLIGGRVANYGLSLRARNAI